MSRSNFRCTNGTGQRNAPVACPRHVQLHNTTTKVWIQVKNASCNLIQLSTHPTNRCIPILLDLIQINHLPIHSYSLVLAEIDKPLQLVNLALIHCVRYGYMYIPSIVPLQSYYVPCLLPVLRSLQGQDRGLQSGCLGIIEMLREDCVPLQPSLIRSYFDDRENTVQSTVFFARLCGQHSININ